jgi:hypothetical protein
MGRHHGLELVQGPTITLRVHAMNSVPQAKISCTEKYTQQLTINKDQVNAAMEGTVGQAAR